MMYRIVPRGWPGNEVYGGRGGDGGFLLADMSMISAARWFPNDSTKGLQLESMGNYQLV